MSKSRFALIIGVVAAASLGYSLYLTAVSQSFAYFATPVRVWEFAAGTLIAVASSRIVVPHVSRIVLSLVGFAAIVATALTFDDTQRQSGSG